MFIQHVTSVLLILLLALPSMPTDIDCGCGRRAPLVRDARTDAGEASHCSGCKNAASCGKTKTPATCCCDKQPTEVARRCCGKSGEACENSAAERECRCGQDCRCGTASEAPAEEQTVPPAEAAGQNHLTQLIGSLIATAHFDETQISLRLQRIRPPFDVDCYSSAERCSQLCRFLR